MSVGLKGGGERERDSEQEREVTGRTQTGLCWGLVIKKSGRRRCRRSWPCCTRALRTLRTATALTQVLTLFESMFAGCKEGRYKATWKRAFKLPRHKAGLLR